MDNEKTSRSKIRKAAKEHSVRIYLNLFPVLKEELSILGITDVRLEEYSAPLAAKSFGRVWFHDENDFLLWKLCSEIYEKRNWNWGLKII